MLAGTAVLIPDFLCDLHRTSTPSVLQHWQIWRIEPQNGNVNKVFNYCIKNTSEGVKKTKHTTLVLIRLFI